jgi:hypothetical protein
LTIKFIRAGAFLQHHHDISRMLLKRSNMEVNDTFSRISRCSKVNSILIHRRKTLPNLLDQGKERTAKRNEIMDNVSTKNRGRHLEKRLRCGIRLHDLTSRPYQEQRVRKRAEYCVAWRNYSRRSLTFREAHAAALEAMPS